MDCSPPGSSVRGIFQARVLEWGAIAFSNDSIIVFINHLNNFLHFRSFSIITIFPSNHLWTKVSLCYHCLLWPSIREAWRAAAHGVAKSWTWLRSWTELMSQIHEGNHILTDSFLESCSPWTLSHWQLNIPNIDFKCSSFDVPGGGSVWPRRSTAGPFSFIYPS